MSPPELAQVQETALAAAADVLVGVNAALVPHIQLATAVRTGQQMYTDSTIRA
jgi:hypothetical protein